MPIIDKGEAEPNDAFVEQLVMNAKAAVEYLVGRGVAHRERIEIGGHSYGSAMAVNLLAHALNYSVVELHVLVHIIEH